jgi:hypothetical protein
LDEDIVLGGLGREKRKARVAATKFEISAASLDGISISKRRISRTERDCRGAIYSRFLRVFSSFSVILEVGFLYSLLSTDVTENSRAAAALSPTTRRHRISE